MVKAKKPENKNYVKIIWKIYFAGLGFVFLLFFMISLGWLGFMPSFEELENPRSNIASEIFSADQVLLGKYFIEDRSNIHYKDLSPDLINALISTEDERYYKHSGVDVRGTIGGILSTFIGDRRGASTITQQLAKNLFPRGKQFFPAVIMRKMKEWVIAIKLERNYTKEEIITMYLNTVPFGGNSFGIKTASRTFYNTSPDSLKIEDGAMLVGMLKAPTFYSPIRNPERAFKRREVVLNQMRKKKHITREQYDSIRVIPFDNSKYKLLDHNTGLATYFREYLRAYLNDWCKNHKKPDGTYYNLYKDGLKIYTPINSKMQLYAEQAVSEHLGKELQKQFFEHWKGRKNAPFSNLSQEQIDNSLNRAMRLSERYYFLKQEKASAREIEKVFNTPVEMKIFVWENGNPVEIDTVMSPMDSIRYYKFFLRSGIMAMEPQTGYVRAYVGGINYKHFKYDQVSTAKRQVGSTFKPFVYALAIRDKGYSPCSKVPNVQPRIELPDGRFWEPKNSNKDREGEMVTLQWALANSINWVSAYLINQTSPGAIIDMLRKMGVNSPIDPVPSIALGAVDLSVQEMVGAQSTFANKGVYIKPIFITRIEDKNGNIIESFIPEQREVLSEEVAYLMLELMKGVTIYGTGVRLRFKYNFENPIAGKTGTTQNNSDGWFMGLTPDLVTGVWVGCEDRGAHFRSTALGQGANMALPIWALFMKKVYADKSSNISKGDFDRPANISVETNCSKFDKENAQDIQFNDIGY